MKWQAGVVALLLTVAGCAPSVPPAAAPASGTASAPAAAPQVLGDAEVGDLVAAMTQRTPKQLATPRLAEGLVPPTNRWYSGLVFGDQPQPVFPLPLAFNLTADGFAFGLPKVTATADTIAGPFAPDVSVGVGAKSAVVTSDDPSVVVVEQRDAAGAAIGRTTIAQGWPFVAWTAERETTVSLPDGFAPAGEVFTATIAGTRYAVKATGTELSGSQANVAAGGSLVFWAVPDGQEPAALAAASAVPTGSTLGYGVDDRKATTTLGFTGAQVMGRLPHQGEADCGLGSYRTIYGELRLCAGSELSWQTERTPARAALDLGGLSRAQRDELVTQLRSDAELPAFPADTYFGGKALQRAAMLLMLADELGERELSDRLAKALDAELAKWTDPKGCEAREAFCFVYDANGKGLIGLTPSFGSDEYNDHHFHYGYFLYAAAVLARHDPSAAERYAPVLNLVAADIASSGSRYFPARRAFDAWAGHSWASGTSPFADGNNQESASEAVNAYAGLELWAEASGNQPLATEAAWLLSAEAASAKAYWTAPDLTGFDGYGHRIVSLNWGGKRDYATWFSPEPAAKLAILLLPMSPTSTYLAGEPDAIRANVAEAVGDDFGVKFGDYIALYAALAGDADRDRALAAVRDRTELDDGLSRSYLLAWLFSAKN